MTLNRFQKFSLGVAGIVVVAIGLSILTVPQAFYAGYGIVLEQNASLLSELRAPGAGLVALGAIMLAGIVRPALAPTALACALAVYIAFPAGRLLSLALDGMPSGGVIGALVAELVIAGLCLAAFLRPGRSAAR